MSDPRVIDSDDERGPRVSEDQLMAEEDIKRRHAEADMEVQIVDAVRTGAGPVQTVRFTASDSFNFRCHSGVPCWNACCHNTDITLTPYDILRLARRFETRPSTVISTMTAPAEHEASGMPVLKLKMMETEDGKRPCVFLDEEKGCTVYADRPAACRYYPLGLASVKMKGHDAPEDFYFLVKEPHCKGHEEAREQTVAQFRREQGVEPYDEHNRGWIDILMKLASWKTVGGPMGKTPTTQTKQMFFMASSDVDRFRRFVFETRFLQVYEVSPEAIEAIKTDDEALLRLGFDWLKQVLFNEPTLALREEVLQGAIAKARANLGGT